MVWMAVIIAGIARDGFMAVLMTTIMEIKGIGATYAGTAMGIVLTLSRLISAISPPLGNSLAGVNPGMPFVLWAAMAAAAMVGFYFLRQRTNNPSASETLQE